MRKIYEKIRSFNLKHPWFGYFFVVIFGLVYFGLIQDNKTILDPDGFYHLRLSLIMLKGVVIKSFPWLTFTYLSRSFTDHHFLYHILLLPFVKYLEPIVAIKIFTTFINTVFLLIFYFFLKNQKIKQVWFYIFILLSSAPFIFRINLIKASSLSLIFLILIMFCIFNKKYKILFFLSFFYVWAYGGWPLSIIISGIFFIASLISNIILKNNFRFYLLKISEYKPILITILGSIFGLIINPYFPGNLYFYWLQIVQIALVNYGSKVGVGMEWYSFNFLSLIKYSGGVLLILLGGILLFFGKIILNKKTKISYQVIRDILFFIITTGFFFILTLKSRRNSEYLYPFLVLLSAVFIKYFWDKDVYIWIKNNLKLFFKKRVAYIIFIVYLILILILAFLLNFLRIKQSLEDGHSMVEFKTAMEIAQNNSSKGDIIFHNDWDDWPMLFYHNQYNRFIVGLDATFMYKYNSELYQKWRDITWGNFEGDPYDIIKNEFGAKLIFIEKSGFIDMDKYLKDGIKYTLLYDGEDARVYKIK